MFENAMFDEKPEESPNMIHQLQFNLAPVSVKDNQKPDELFCNCYTILCSIVRVRVPSEIAAGTSKYFNFLMSYYIFISYI